MIKIPEVWACVNLELAPKTNGTITDVTRLIRNLNLEWMYIESPILGADRLRIREKLLLLKHFSGRDSSLYTDAEEEFMASQNAEDLIDWGIRQRRFYL